MEFDILNVYNLSNSERNLCKAKWLVSVCFIGISVSIATINVCNIIDWNYRESFNERKWKVVVAVEGLVHFSRGNRPLEDSERGRRKCMFL